MLFKVLTKSAAMPAMANGSLGIMLVVYEQIYLRKHNVP